MIDEFPQTIQNIAHQHGANTAKQFLQFKREIRQLANSTLGFIFTGSIGLKAITEKLETTQTITDLNTIEIPPISKSQATDLVMRFLDEARIAYQPDTGKVTIGYHTELRPKSYLNSFSTTKIKLT